MFYQNFCNRVQLSLPYWCSHHQPTCSHTLRLHVGYSVPHAMLLQPSRQSVKLGLFQSFPDMQQWSVELKAESGKNSPLAAFPAHFSLPLEQARSTLTNGVLICTTVTPFKQTSAQDSGWKCPLSIVFCNRLAQKGYRKKTLALFYYAYLCTYLLVH